jgi:hypothetical protein
MSSKLGPGTALARICANWETAEIAAGEGWDPQCKPAILDIAGLHPRTHDQGRVNRRSLEPLPGIRRLKCDGSGGVRAN